MLEVDFNFEDVEFQSSSASMIRIGITNDMLPELETQMKSKKS